MRCSPSFHLDSPWRTTKSVILSGHLVSDRNSRNVTVQGSASFLVLTAIFTLVVICKPKKSITWENAGEAEEGAGRGGLGGQTHAIHSACIITSDFVDCTPAYMAGKTVSFNQSVKMNQASQNTISSKVSQQLVEDSKLSPTKRHRFAHYLLVG